MTHMGKSVNSKEPEGGHWDCSKCGMDWGYGHNLIPSGNPSKGYKYYCTGSKGGCGNSSVEWIEPEPKAETVPMTKEEFDWVKDATDPADDMEKHKGLLMLPSFPGGAIHERNEFCNSNCRPHPQSVELFKLRDTVRKFEEQEVALYKEIWRLKLTGVCGCFGEDEA